jgi:hypothetical protein
MLIVLGIVRPGAVWVQLSVMAIVFGVALRRVISGVHASAGGQEFLVVRTHETDDRVVHLGDFGIFGGQLSLFANSGTLAMSERSRGARDLYLDRLLPEKIWPNRKARRGCVKKLADAGDAELRLHHPYRQ